MEAMGQVFVGHVLEGQVLRHGQGEPRREHPLHGRVVGGVDEQGGLAALHALGASAMNVHVRVFPHVLARPLDVLEWVRGTALHPVRVALPDEAAYDAFLASYAARLEHVLGPPDMPYLFTFKRTFLWARFDEPAPR